MSTLDTNPYAALPTPVWFASLDAALEWARAGNRALVVFFVAEWCDWSARLFAETLAEVGVRAMLQHVGCMRIEGDRNLPLVEHWNVDIYPTALVLASGGAELGRIRGFEDGPRWAERLHGILMRGAVPRQAG